MTCTKTRYLNRGYAKVAARDARLRGVHVRPYRCRSCGLWHIGHIPRKVLRGLVTAKQVYDWQAERAS